MFAPSTIDFELTVLHYLANNSDVSGRDLREHVNQQLQSRLTGPGFYQRMANMEDAGYVTSYDREKTVEGIEIKERTYNINREKGNPRRSELLETRERLGPDGLLGGLAPT